MPREDPGEPLRPAVSQPSELSLIVRPERPEDARFLLALYASTRDEELNATGWDPAVRAAFIEMQFRCQTQSYHRDFPSGQFSIVMLNGEAIGRIVVDRRAQEIRVVDIVLAPASRCLGIGTRLMKTVMEEAAHSNRPLRIHVLRGTREARWYERLGFVPIGQIGFHDEMEWKGRSK